MDKHLLSAQILVLEYDYMLGVFLIVDDGMMNEGAWAALGFLFDFLFSQHIDSSLCQISNTLKGSLRGTCLVSLFKLDQWVVWGGSMWRHLALHDALGL